MVSGENHSTSNNDVIYFSCLCMQFQGKHIRVDMATAPRKDGQPGVDNASQYDRTRSLFIGNVPFDVEVLSSSHNSWL